MTPSRSSSIYISWLPRPFAGSRTFTLLGIRHPLGFDLRHPLGFDLRQGVPVRTHLKYYPESSPELDLASGWLHLQFCCRPHPQFCTTTTVIMARISGDQSGWSDRLCRELLARNSATGFYPPSIGTSVTQVPYAFRSFRRSRQ